MKIKKYLGKTVSTINKDTPTSKVKIQRPYLSGLQNSWWQYLIKKLSWNNYIDNLVMRCKNSLQVIRATSNINCDEDVIPRL